MSKIKIGSKKIITDLIAELKQDRDNYRYDLHSLKYAVQEYTNSNFYKMKVVYDHLGLLLFKFFNLIIKKTLYGFGYMLGILRIGKNYFISGFRHK